MLFLNMVCLTVRLASRLKDTLKITEVDFVRKFDISFDDIQKSVGDHVIPRRRARLT
jgi:hypothetical protein